MHRTTQSSTRKLSSQQKGYGSKKYANSYFLMNIKIYKIGMKN